VTRTSELEITGERSEGEVKRSEAIGKLLSPRSVALVGASDRNGWSVLMDQALTLYGFDGDVFYVNPRGGTAHGHELHTSLSALPVVPDLAFVMVPAVAVPGVVEEAASLGVPAAEILSSGFSEVGPEGVPLQERVRELGERSGMAILGPNNLGFANITDGVGLTPTMGQKLRAGSVAMISQSGNLAGQIQTLARSFDVGLSIVASTGNEVDVTAGELVDYLVDHEPTKAIGVFLETIRKPEQFVRATRRAHAAGKPVVVLKAGRSEAAARSAMAHTGSLVGDDAIIEAALTAAGVIRVETLEDLIAVADVFTKVGAIGGRRLGVVSISGGAGDIASDLAEPAGLLLPDISDETKVALKPSLPDYGTPQNPLDMTGLIISRPEIFGEGLAALGSDSNLDAVIAITEAEHQAADLADPTLSGLLAAADASPLPALLVTTTVHTISEQTLELRRQREIPAVSWGLDRVINAIAALAQWGELTPTPLDEIVGEVDTDDLGQRRGVWSESRSRELIARNGVPVAPSVVVANGAAAADAAREMTGPFALKIVSDDIPHKSDVGGVVLNVPAEQLSAQVDAVLANVAEKRPDARLDGVLVGPMRSGGVELLVGVVRDADWGCVLAVAMGGIWTEVLHDVQRIALPTTPDTILRGIRSLRSFALLEGARGTKPADLDELTRVVQSIGDLALRLGPALAALEVNPLRVDGSTVEALDAMVVWQD
jgi:acyl-CoA synthetase (NDP forming)